MNPSLCWNSVTFRYLSPANGSYGHLSAVGWNDDGWNGSFRSARGGLMLFLMVFSFLSFTNQQWLQYYFPHLWHDLNVFNDQCWEVLLCPVSAGRTHHQCTNIYYSRPRGGRLRCNVFVFLCTTFLWHWSLNVDLRCLFVYCLTRTKQPRRVLRPLEDQVAFLEFSGYLKVAPIIYF